MLYIIAFQLETGTKSIEKLLNNRVISSPSIYIRNLMVMRVFGFPIHLTPLRTPSNGFHGNPPFIRQIAVLA